jgi:hypothetical protein
MPNLALGNPIRGMRGERFLTLGEPGAFLRSAWQGMIAWLWAEQGERHDANAVPAAVGDHSGVDDDCVEQAIADLAAQP